MCPCIVWRLSSSMLGHDLKAEKVFSFYTFCYQDPSQKNEGRNKQEKKLPKFLEFEVHSDIFPLLYFLFSLFFKWQV